MQLPGEMATLSHILNKLRIKGMDKDISWKPEGFTIDGEQYYRPDELRIIKVYRFEELKDPGDQCVLYLIKTNDGAIGQILDAYGTYSSHDENGFANAMRRIPEEKQQEQLLFEL
jgi:hypothetical protein